MFFDSIDTEVDNGDDNTEDEDSAFIHYIGKKHENPNMTLFTIQNSLILDKCL